MDDDLKDLARAKTEEDEQRVRLKGYPRPKPDPTFARVLLGIFILLAILGYLAFRSWVKSKMEQEPPHYVPAPVSLSDPSAWV